MNKVEQYNPFGVDTEIVHADWWPEEWTVTVRELSYSQVQSLTKHGIDSTKPLPKNKREAKNQKRTYGDLTIGNLQLHTTFAGIESWTFTDPEGKAIPLSIANLKRLRRKDGDFIEEAVDAINPDRDDEFQGTSGDSEND